MTDIVKRLEAIDHMNVDECFLDSHLYAEAAAEIRRLREQCEAMAGSLAPFAKASEIRLCGGDYWTNEKSIQGTDIAFHIKFGDLRDAHSTLAAYRAWEK